MFRDTLLESSPAGRKRQRWPMATAFAVEVAVAGLLIVLPLLSTGILPVSAHPPLIALSDMPVAGQNHAESHPSSGGPRYPVERVVIPFGNNRSDICRTNCKPPTNEPDDNGPGWNPGIGGDGSHSGGLCLTCVPAVKPVPGKPVPVSEASLALLTHRVEPVYPRMAILTKLEGQVRLHAIIAKDGSIRSLEVMSGHPLLASAAMDAVRQWRYQAYKLNGEPVEVETFITVNFRATGN